MQRDFIRKSLLGNLVYVEAFQINLKNALGKKLYLHPEKKTKNVFDLKLHYILH